MLGDEQVVERHRVRARAAQARAVPGVEHLEVRGRHQEQPHVGMVLALAKDEAADHDPLRVADAARPRPLAVEPVAAGRDLGLAGGGGRGGDAGVAVLAPHVVLRLVGEMREDAGVVAEIVQAPGRRAAGGAAELDRDIERDLVIVLVAVPALGHDRAHEPGVDIFLDRLARDVAVALGLDRALAQLRRQRAGALHQLLPARNALHRRNGRHCFHGSHAHLPWIAGRRSPRRGPALCSQSSAARSVCSPPHGTRACPGSALMLRKSGRPDLRWGGVGGGGRC